MNWHLLENPFYPLGHCCLANGKGGHLIQAETIKSYTYKWDCFFQLRNWKRVAWSPFPPAAMCSDQASETQQTHRAKARAETGPADDTQSPRPLIPSVSLTSLPQSQSHQQINSLFGLSWAELGFSWLEPGKWKESEVTPSCPTLRPHGLWPTRCLCPQDFPGSNTRMGCHFLLQGIFQTHRSNLGLLHCRQTLYPLTQPYCMQIIMEIYIIEQTKFKWFL